MKLKQPPPGEQETATLPLSSVVRVGKKVWAGYKRWKARRSQKTFCYCKNCNNELCGDPATQCFDAGDEVHYICGKCDWQNDFLFEAPVPIFLRAIEPEKPIPTSNEDASR